MYSYELHLHTKETSRCGHVPAAEQVRTYHNLGYTGICITDHLHDGYYDPSLSVSEWHEAMESHLLGYRNAAEEGSKLGMDIILGAELRFPGSDRDYLIYGIGESWLFDHPHMCHMSVQEFYARYHNEVLIIQAHPYRGYDTVYWDSIHGLEICNTSPRHDSRDHLALALLKEHPYFYPIAGSDAHRHGDEGGAALLCEHRIHDSFEMKKVITSEQYSLWCPAYQKIIEESEALKHV